MHNDPENEHILLPVANVGHIEKLLEFTLLIREKKSPHPVSILSVVSNNEEAEINIVKARNKLQEFVRQASASDSPVDVITTIDHNVAGGISRISREIMADIVIVGWAQKSNVLDRIVGDKMDSILNTTDKTIIVGHFGRPIVTHKRIVVVAPPLAERENGFELWLSKMSKLAQELSIPLLFCVSPATEKGIAAALKRMKSAAKTSFLPFEDWEDFMVLARTVGNDDLFVLVSARRGSASFINQLDGLPGKMEKYFADNNRLVVYPQQFELNHISESYEDVSSEPLTRGIETIQKIGKGIGNIFRKEDEP